jgi:hypothetical protein
MRQVRDIEDDRGDRTRGSRASRRFARFNDPAAPSPTNKQRPNRLAKDVEATIESSITWLYIASVKSI